MKSSSDSTPADSPLRIVFAGTPEFAADHLKALLEEGFSNPGFEVVGVYTQPDRPAGRGKKLTPSPVKTVATEHQLPVYQPNSLKDAEAQVELAGLKPDLMIVVAYGQLLPTTVLNTPRLGCINVHASLLPRWRGAAPIQRAIASGDQTTGVTIMQMDEGLDTGDMLTKAECAITDLDTAASLHDKLSAIGAPALIKTIYQIADNSLSPEPQNDRLSTYAGKISKSEAQVNWLESAETVANKIRAFNPLPVAFGTICGERVRIWSANSLKMQHSSKPGEILDSQQGAVLVACGEGVIELTEVQLANKKRLPVAEVLKSRSSLFAPGNSFIEPVEESSR